MSEEKHKFEQEHRENIIKEIHAMRVWLRRLEDDLKSNSTDVIGFIQLEGIQKASTGIIYEAGLINGAVMERYEHEKQ